MPKPKAPRWTVRGDIPHELNPQTATDEQLELLDEDMLQMIDPTGTYTVDVGWYPAATRSGRFICRVVRSEDWDRPLDQLETPNIKIAWKWLKQQINEVDLRVGQTGTFTANVGLFIHQVARTSRAKKTRPAARKPRVIPTFLRPPSLPSNLMPPFDRPFSTTNQSETMAVGLPELPLANAA
jgi:hypothetical protein